MEATKKKSERARVELKLMTVVPRNSKQLEIYYLIEIPLQVGPKKEIEARLVSTVQNISTEDWLRLETYECMTVCYNTLHTQTTTCVLIAKHLNNSTEQSPS